jgi:5'-3' exonuclease
MEGLKLVNKFLLIDASHLFWRARHSVRGDQSEKIGMILHILFNSLNKAWRTQNANHIVFCFDGHSWRKSVYKPYKANRAEARSTLTCDEINENKLFFEAYDIFREFIKTKTNCTVLEHSTLEADDLIAGFIQSHPLDIHTIVSSDKDFEQLLAENVILYNGVDDTTTTIHGIFDYKGKSITDKKTGMPKIAPDPEWSVFEKCVRGCSTDNIFSAYPGIREKGTKNKIGLREAFEDRYKKGFAWNAVMQHHWSDHLGVDHKVADDYIRNKQLVDLTAQPAEIKTLISETILNSCNALNRTQIGVSFLRFCGRYELQRISEQSGVFANMLKSQYPDV